MMTGEVRSFKDTYVSIRSNLLDGLSPGCPQNVHLFLYPSMPSSMKGGGGYEVNLSGESQNNKNHNNDVGINIDTEVDKIKKSLEESFKGSDYAATFLGVYQSGVVPNRCKSYPSNSTSLLYQSQAELYDLVPSKGDFDFFVRARFDIAFFATVPPAESFAKDRFHTNSNHFPISDQFAIIPREVAEIYYAIMNSYFGCFDDVDSVYFRLFNDDEFGQNEALLLAHLHKNGVKVKRHETLRFAIVREQKGAECGRLRSISLDAVESCVRYFGASNVYRRGGDVERSEKSMFNFNFKYANPHFGRFEESVISFSLDNFVLELLKFCGRARTTKGYLVPCGETARELFTTMGSYKKHFNSALFVDNSFVEKSFMNSQLITKAEGILDGKDVSSLSGGMREYTFDSLGHLTEQELEDEDILSAIAKSASELLLRSHSQGVNVIADLSALRGKGTTTTLDDQDSEIPVCVRFESWRVCALHSPRNEASIVKEICDEMPSLPHCSHFMHHLLPLRRRDISLSDKNRMESEIRRRQNDSLGLTTFDKLDRIGTVEDVELVFVQIGGGKTSSGISSSYYLKPYALAYGWRGLFISARSKITLEDDGDAEEMFAAMGETTDVKPLTPPRRENQSQDQDQNQNQIGTFGFEELLGSFRVLRVDDITSVDFFAAINFTLWQPQLVLFDHTHANSITAVRNLHSQRYSCELMTLVETSCERSNEEEAFDQVKKSSASDPLNFVELVVEHPDPGTLHKSMCLFFEASEAACDAVIERLDHRETFFLRVDQNVTETSLTLSLREPPLTAIMAFVYDHKLGREEFTQLRDELLPKWTQLLYDAFQESLVAFSSQEFIV